MKFKRKPDYYEWEDIEILLEFDRELEQAILFEEALRQARKLEKPFKLDWDKIIDDVYEGIGL